MVVVGGGSQRLLCLNPTTVMVVLLLGLWLLLGCDNNVDAEYRKSIGDIILWNTPVIKDKDVWPSRKKYSFIQLFRDKENLVET